MVPDSADCLIIGGGVVGLSLAYELSGRGVATTLIDHQPLGREASWAGAGILTPGSWYESHPALDDLATLSGELNPRWAADLLEATGIDNEFRVCGGTYLASSREDLARLSAVFERWTEFGIRVDPIDSAALAQREPALSQPPHELVQRFGGYHIPQEGQLRNPRHVAALAAGSLKRGVRILTPCQVKSISARGTSVASVTTDGGSITCDQIVLAAGAWSAEIAELWGFRLPVRPVRGQVILYPVRSPALLNGNVHLDGFYAVPRRDGRVLVGATVEDVGFDKATTEAGLESLASWAQALCEPLVELPVERTWAGLRPASPDGLPYIGAVARYSNLWVATGHYRAGLQFASATAVALADHLTGRPSSLDLHPFRLDR